MHANSSLQDLWRSLPFTGLSKCEVPASPSLSPTPRSDGPLQLQWLARPFPMSLTHIYIYLYMCFYRVTYGEICTGMDVVVSVSDSGQSGGNHEELCFLLHQTTMNDAEV